VFRKIGGACVWKTKKGKGTKWIVVAGQGIPLGSILASSSAAEVKLTEQNLDAVSVPRAGQDRPKKRPKRLIGDKGYDSDTPIKCLKKLKIDMIVSYRRNRKKDKKQDGRKLRRYRKRWKVERTFAWLGNLRRLVRYGLYIKMYQAFFYHACLIIVLNRF
jgi:transposase